MEIKWDKMEKKTRRKDRKRKAGTKTSNDVGDVGKEEREREGETNEIHGETNEIHFYSSRKYKCRYSILLGIQNNSANE